MPEARLPVRAMKRLIKFQMSPRERLQARAIHRYLQRINASNSGDRVNQSFELTVFPKRSAALQLDFL